MTQFSVINPPPLPTPPPHTHTHTHTSSLEGIVVAKEYEEVLLEAWEQEEQVLIEKEIKVIKCT